MTGFTLTAQDRLEHVLQGDACATILIGSYDGSSNYGDLLQLKATTDLHHKLRPHRKIFCIVDEAARENFDRNAAYFGFNSKTIVPIFINQLCAPPEAYEIRYLPTDLFVHFYGGGYINDAWGAQKRMAGEQILQMHQQLSPDGSRSIVMSGLQVSPGAELERWRPLLDRAVYVGGRDHDTVELLKQQLSESEHAKVRFSGDDAYYLLPASSMNAGREPAPLAVHINPADYSSSDPKQRVRSIAQIIAAAARRSLGSGRCEILIAYPEARIGEDAAARELIDAYTSLVADEEASPLTFTVRDLVAELNDGDCRFEASFLVTCSYHVALTALVSDCPTLLLAENSYYRQKASGLESVFRALSTENPSNMAQAEKLVEEAIHRRTSGCHARGAHIMARAQLEKTLDLAEIIRKAETARLDEDFASIKVAFSETAQQLGELRRRSIVETKIRLQAEQERIRRQAEDEARRQVEVENITRQAEEARRQADEAKREAEEVKRRAENEKLERPYWVKRGISLQKSLRKRMDRTYLVKRRNSIVRSFRKRIARAFAS